MRLTPLQRTVLTTLALHGPATGPELNDLCRSTQAGACALQMFGKGLVEGRRGDNYRWYITDAGREALRREGVAA